MVECKLIIGPHVDAVGRALGRQSVLRESPQALIFKHKLTVYNFHVVGQSWWVFVL